MTSLCKPSPPLIRSFLARQQPREFTYSALGATAATPPQGFAVDHTRICLGRGASSFHAAAAAMRHWEQFRLGWVEAWPTNTPLRAGETVAVLGRVVGLWWLNACRIVYVIDEAGPTSLFGFAYGTLPGHVESGEERFLITWDQATDEVWYDILAFSRPRHMLAKLGYPFVRCLQKHFGRDSALAMFRAGNGSAAIPEIYQTTQSRRVASASAG